NGDADPAFWRSLYKLDDMSGGPYITGWVSTLFPYVVRRQQSMSSVVRNAYVAWRSVAKYDGLKSDDVLPGVTPVPFRWIYLAVDLAMEIHAGFLGVAHDRDLGAIRPAIGWTIAEVDPRAAPGGKSVPE